MTKWWLWRSRDEALLIRQAATSAAVANRPGSAPNRLGPLDDSGTRDVRLVVAVAAAIAVLNGLSVRNSLSTASTGAYWRSVQAGSAREGRMFGSGYPVTSLKRQDPR